MESFSEQPDPITYAWLDENKHIWLCNKDTIFLYNTETQLVTHIKNDISEEITDIEQIDESHFFIGTEMGIHYAKLENNALELINCDKFGEPESPDYRFIFRQKRFVNYSSELFYGES